MDDLIIEVIDGSTPLEALNSLFSVAFAVAAENGISEFTLTRLFDAHVSASFEIADAEEDEDEGEEDEDEGEGDE
jgi:hypothetical protein